jgi:DNA repair protein RecN (Recombination protein N)
MLHTLHVRNLALIERAELRLHAGLNVVSGETGGGKSLLITALALLRGEKCAGTLVRHGTDELQVDAEFRLGSGERSAAVAALVTELCGAVLEDGELLVTRIVDRQGRSRVRIGGRPATLAALRSVGSFLLEIHGQGDTRALMRPEMQSETLDAFAGTAALRREFAAALAAARAAQGRLLQRTTDQRERLKRLEFLRFQHREMSELRLQDGELAELEAEQQLLSNADTMRQRLSAALLLLQDGEANAAELLAQAQRQLAPAAAIDRRLENAVDQLGQGGELLAEVCRQLQSGLARCELDPLRLQAVEERLNEIHRALQRYGPTAADLQQNQLRVAAELQEHEAAEADPEALAVALQQRRDAAVALARRLHRARKQAAGPFAERIAAELQDLGMARTQVRAAMADDFTADRLLDDATEHGPLPVDFEVRINPGEPFHALRETASGGELARVVLAIKKTLADQDRVPLLVLDEIDAEIGGRLGLQVGHKLHDVAAHHQVVIVTHLPQVAAFAGRHFLVEKAVLGAAAAERTASSVQELRGAAIERELAAMAMGDSGDAAALQQARVLVQRAKAAEAGG